MSVVNLYVETNIRGVGKKKGKYIYLLETETSKGLATIHDIKEIEATKDVAELTAIATATSRLTDKTCELNIYVTSEQLMHNLRHFLKNWAKRNFCKADGRRLSCWQLWKTVYENTNICDMRVYNKSHSYSSWLLKQL